MGDRHIIPIPAATDDGPLVLVEAKREGSRPLDVRLVGCEGENPYVTTISHRDIGQLKRNFKGSNEEWEAILSHFLLQKQPEGENTNILNDINLVNSTDDNEIRLIIRRDVKGIKVTLGEISLPYDAEFEISPFEWAQISAQAHSLALGEITQLTAKLNSKQSQIDQLNAQLEDFIKTKNETETAMLQQFMELLNEKKRKIRDQQRLLAGAKVDKATASAVQSSREATEPRKAGPSRASKRKAAGKAVAAKPESESDHMEVDGPNVEEENEEEDIPEAVTPDRTTDDETEDEEGPTSPARQLKDGSAETTGANTTVAQPSKDAHTRPDPPPRRELPFGRPATRSKSTRKQPSPPGGDEDSETEDEEL
ncbi:hypothetical protein K469DRAFT_728344 [Zopfia rhizophila CBS 207.26]|uniref:DNA double-strand break repair and VJ recombination XRCC4 n=1 Tax=Zopfia rhizophila CBS 207.26 TaxID=1314779 RepID=A0A6A6DVB6_9PEZI|nr:hypothetical protein K469DRAFT_728344 [Zopfia rhizophila CBS 207.26]